MDLTLTNIRKNLIIAFKLLDQHVKTGEYTKAVIAVGDTGCGKSTLLSSIILGPSKLKVVEIPIKIQTKTGVKTKKKKVIDYVDKNYELLPIGHSMSKSMTFFPKFYAD